MFAVPSFFGYNTTFVSTPVATAATGVGETSFTANWNAFAGASYYLLDVSTSSSFSSFVGSYQNFVVISNSQVVSGLTANTTYYYRLRAATGVDADAASFFSRVYTAGGSLSYTEVSATETLVANLKSNSLWTPMKAIYPMVGASAAACAQNLKSSSFTGTFTSGWTFASTGVTPNGTSAYMNTAFNPNTECATANVGGMGIYSRTNRLGSTSAVQGIQSSSYFGGWVRYTDNKTYAAINDGTGNGVNNSQTNLFWQIARNNSSTTLIHCLNNTIISATQSATTKPNVNVYFGASNNGSAATGFDTLEMALCYLSGDALGSTNLQNMYTAVQAFQTTLARQV